MEVSVFERFRFLLESPTFYTETLVLIVTGLATAFFFAVVLP